MQEVFASENIIVTQPDRHQGNEFLQYLEQQYNTKKGQIFHTIQSALRVRHYQHLPSPNDKSAYSSYARFRSSVPITTSNDLFPPDDLVPGDTKGLIVHPSGGSTGRRMKEIVIPPDALVLKFSDKVIEILKKAKNPVLLHKDLHILSYRVTEESLRNQAPNVRIKTYTSPTEVLKKIKDNDVVCITEQVSKFRELMHVIETKAIEVPEELIKSLEGKRFFVEIGAEPINLDEIKKWYGLLQKYTGVDPEFWGLYGTTETLLIGLGIYHPGDDKMYYEVKDDRFVEILLKDRDSISSPGELGRVVITPLRGARYPGTNILRYDTGDLARAVIKDGKMFLTDIQRSPDDGMISLWGHKIYVPQMHAILENDIGFPMALEAGSVTINDANSENERIILSINVYSEHLQNEQTKSKAEKMTMEMLKQVFPDVENSINSGKLTIQTKFAAESKYPMIKAWRLFNPEQDRIQEAAERNY